jgi:hypothetical protein
VRLPDTPLRRPAGVLFILKSDRGALLRSRRPCGVELSVALFDAASPLVPGNSGADMVRASALACSSDFLTGPCCRTNSRLLYCLRRFRAVPFGVVKPYVNVGDTMRVGDMLAILTRNIERGRARMHRMAPRVRWGIPGCALLFRCPRKASDSGMLRRIHSTSKAGSIAFAALVQRASSYFAARILRIEPSSLFGKKVKGV